MLAESACAVNPKNVGCVCAGHKPAQAQLYITPEA